ncbi:tRNA(Met) cytidine acetate ligase [Veillonella intestinalis]|uniref:tRNA(Met) cytidine acetate ligase n=1 Tax=Veillonella intestinalis TaxID=2941341 RepID=UPI002040C501|nr:nucleotidyltransferase family protein [Veillonella intestinalis]
MKCIGIVAEYNPFHIGHAHQLQQLRQAHPDALIIIAMSGSFVQRGEPAIFNKFIRARWALLNGANAVLELPTIYATANAERFAAGAVRLLASVGATALSFGSETTDLTALQQIANLSHTPEVQAHCQQRLQEGYFYGAALRDAIATVAPKAEPILQHPNALLGIEYLKALKTYQLDLDVYLVQREGAHHNASLTSPWPSGSALRHHLYTAQTTREANHEGTDMNFLHKLTDFVPTNIQKDYTELVLQGELLDLSRYEDFLLYESRQRTAEDLQQLCDFKEGLENRWPKASQATTWNAARELLKSKRYSYARLNRMSAYTMLQIAQQLQDDAHQQGPTYARLLGFTKEARPWLQAKNFTIPVVQKWAPFLKEAQGLTAQLAQLDQRATDLQALCFKHPAKRSGGTDYTFTPWYIINTP